MTKSNSKLTISSIKSLPISTEGIYLDGELLNIKHILVIAIQSAVY